MGCCNRASLGGWIANRLAVTKVIDKSEYVKRRLFPVHLPSPWLPFQGGSRSHFPYLDESRVLLYTTILLCNHRRYHGQSLLSDSCQLSLRHAVLWQHGSISIRAPAHFLAPRTLPKTQLLTAFFIHLGIIIRAPSTTCSVSD